MTLDLRGEGGLQKSSYGKANLEDKKEETRQLFFDIKADKIPAQYAETNLKGCVSISQFRFRFDLMQCREVFQTDLN